MSLLQIQTSRIRAALRSVLRAANGREPSDAEVNSRAAAYIRPGTRGLGPGDSAPGVTPLFRAADYAPYGPDAPLGGGDGRDVSRGWAAVREDLDAAGESISEQERRLARAGSVLRGRSALLASRVSALTRNAEALQTQTQELFSGGAAGAAAAGRGRRVWDVPAGDSPSYPQTTAVLVSQNAAALPTLNDAGASDTGTLSSLTLVASSDASLLSGDAYAREFVEQPLASGPAWNFTHGDLPASMTLTTASAVGAIELSVSASTSLSGLRNDAGAPLPFQTVVDGSTLWAVPGSPVPAGSRFTMELTGTPSDPRKTGSASSGSVISVRAHSFRSVSSAELVWGPFRSLAQGRTAGAFAVSLEQVRAALPQAGAIDHYVSTSSADGPWVPLPPVGGTLTLSASGREEADLPASQSRPDVSTAGFYLFPLSQPGSLSGAELSAGEEQAQAEAYQFSWESQGEVAHQVTRGDWDSPQGTVRNVAMGAGPLMHGDSPGVGVARGTYASVGTVLSRYTDTAGADLTYIALRDADGDGGSPNFVLQKGFNYRFTFALYTSEPSNLTDVPIGVFNPNGAAPAGRYGLPLLVELNGSKVYQTFSTFKDFREVSAAPVGHGSAAGDYAQASPSQSYQDGGAAWPPYCGRMNLALRSGWNTLQISLYVPSSDAVIDTALGPWSGVVFGPNLLADAQTRYQATGIQRVRGWADPWEQLSEFDLRYNTPLGRTQTWAWAVDPATAAVSGVLLNHNPALSETGYPTLDGLVSGQPRTHRVSYLPPVPAQAGAGTPTMIWVRSVLSSSDPASGPVLGGLRFSVN